MRTLLCGLAQNAAKRSQGKNSKIIKIVSHYVFLKEVSQKIKGGIGLRRKISAFDRY